MRSRGAGCDKRDNRGVFAAIAVTFVSIALGSGSVFPSPRRSWPRRPRARSRCSARYGWFLRKRLVLPPVAMWQEAAPRADACHTSETKFRDATSGLVVWAIGVVVTSILLAAIVEERHAAATTATLGARRRAPAPPARRHRSRTTPTRCSHQSASSRGRRRDECHYGRPGRSAELDAEQWDAQ